MDVKIKGILWVSITFLLLSECNMLSALHISEWFIERFCRQRRCKRKYCKTKKKIFFYLEQQQKGRLRRNIFLFHFLQKKRIFYSLVRMLLLLLFTAFGQSIFLIVIYHFDTSLLRNFLHFFLIPYIRLHLLRIIVNSQLRSSHKIIHKQNIHHRFHEIVSIDLTWFILYFCIKFNETIKKQSK